MIGETLGRYQITAHVGAGAMGDVYRAEDLRLRRTVALKLLRSRDRPDHDPARLLAEARAASRLSHPNIAAVYDADEVGHEGRRVGFMAMEFVSGRTLAAVAADGRLPLDRILVIGGQIAEALAHAHDLGVVHRDIKPANVMVTDTGLVKVLDFGVAKPSSPVVDPEAPTTMSGASWIAAEMVVGSLFYMSPEQATGRPLDGRSDMFSLGVLLYELVAGRRPFDGDTPAQVFEALLTRTPAPLEAHAVDPRMAATERAILRMLARDPSARFASLTEAAQVLADIRRGEIGAGSSATGPARVAVGALRNISADAADDWLGTGIAETLAVDLGGLSGVAVIHGGRLHGLVRRLAQEAGQNDDAVLVRAGRELGANWIVTGSFQRAGESLRVTASLLEAATSQAVRTIRVDGRAHEVFALQDQLVRGIAEGLRAVMTPADGATADTGLVGAYEAFSRGVLNLRSEAYESLERAVAFFARAVAIDPRYARAHVELGAALATKAEYLAIPEVRNEAVRVLRRAIELQPDSVRALRELGMLLVMMGRGAEGFAAIERALALDPSDSGACGTMGRALLIGRARFADAAAWYERALEQNPNAGWYALQLAHCAALIRDFPRGERMAHRAVDLQRMFLSGQEGVHMVGASMRLGHLAALQGRHEEAIRCFSDEIDQLAALDHPLRSRIIVELNARLGASYQSLGDARKARALFETAIRAFDGRVRLGADDPFTRYYAAAAHALNGDADTAVMFLTRAAAERPEFTRERARIEPEFEGLRRDPRLQSLLDRR